MQRDMNSRKLFLTPYQIQIWTAGTASSRGEFPGRVPGASSRGES